LGDNAQDVYLNSTNGATTSVVTVVGRTMLNGSLYEKDGVGQLNLDLVGLTPAKLAALAAQNGNTSGSITLGTNTYTWHNLTLVDNAISLELVVDSGLVNAAAAVDNATSNIGLPQGFDPFYVEAAGNPEAAMNTLVGREINQGLDVIGVNIGTTLASDTHQHLDSLLTGNQLGGIDLGGLHVNEAGSMLAMGDTSSQLDSLLRMANANVVGGTEMSDSKQMVCCTTAAPKWGVWVSGNVTLADQDAISTFSGFHSTLGSPTIGVDYRVCPDLVLGVLGSYTTGSADFGDGSNIGVDAEIAALYGAWRSGNWHVDGIAGGGLTQFHDSRSTFGGLTANSTVRGDDFLVDSTAGYDFNLGDNFMVTPELGVQYTHLDLDSFSEEGAGLFNLSEGDQNIDSLRTHLGFKISKAFHLAKDLTFAPEVRAQWYHEFLDDSRGVSESLPGAPAIGSFSVNTFEPERDFALLGVGLNTAFTGYKGVPIGLFVNYNAQVGQDDFIANSVNAGIRVDF
jgi:outer membrane autotransporter protein